MKLKLYITNMETDQIVKFVGYDHYYDEVMSKTSFWNYMSGCTVVMQTRILIISIQSGSDFMFMSMESCFKI